MSKISLAELNHASREQFVAACGPFFEHSPWIAERTWERRPFGSLAELHEKLVETAQLATETQQVNLIAAHPDLVGRLAREGRLTQESTSEQASAGLIGLSATDAAQFDTYNQAYRDKFHFPFVICARENKKAAILAAFPARLNNSRDAEIHTALAEIGKIARLRLLDALTET